MYLGKHKSAPAPAQTPPDSAQSNAPALPSAAPKSSIEKFTPWIAGITGLLTIFTLTMTIADRARGKGKPAPRRKK